MTRPVPAAVLALWLAGSAAGAVALWPGGAPGPAGPVLAALRRQLPAGAAAPELLALRGSSTGGHWQLAFTLTWRVGARHGAVSVVGAERSPLAPAAVAGPALAVAALTGLLDRLPAIPAGGLALLRVDPGAPAVVQFCRSGPGGAGRCRSLDIAGRTRSDQPAVLRAEPPAGPLAVSAADQ